MSEMLVHVLIQTAITFEMLKSYRGCADYKFQLGPKFLKLASK